MGIYLTPAMQSSFLSIINQHTEQVGHAVYRTGRPFPQITADCCEELWNRGYYVFEIAKYFKLSDSTVRYLLAQRGIVDYVRPMPLTPEYFRDHCVEWKTFDGTGYVYARLTTFDDMNKAHTPDIDELASRLPDLTYQRVEDIFRRMYCPDYEEIKYICDQLQLDMYDWADFSIDVKWYIQHPNCPKLSPVTLAKFDKDHMKASPLKVYIDDCDDNELAAAVNWITRPVEIRHVMSVTRLIRNFDVRPVSTHLGITDQDYFAIERSVESYSATLNEKLARFYGLRHDKQFNLYKTDIYPRNFIVHMQKLKEDIEQMEMQEFSENLPLFDDDSQVGGERYSGERQYWLDKLPQIKAALRSSTVEALYELERRTNNGKWT